MSSNTKFDLLPQRAIIKIHFDNFIHDGSKISNIHFISCLYQCNYQKIHINQVLNYARHCSLHKGRQPSDQPLWTHNFLSMSHTCPLEVAPIKPLKALLKALLKAIKWHEPKTSMGRRESNPSVIYKPSMSLKQLEPEPCFMPKPNPM